MTTAPVAKALGRRGRAERGGVVSATAIRRIATDEERAEFKAAIVGFTDAAAALVAARDTAISTATELLERFAPEELDAFTQVDPRVEMAGTWWPAVGALGYARHLLVTGESTFPEALREAVSAAGVLRYVADMWATSDDDRLAYAAAAAESAERLRDEMAER